MICIWDEFMTSPVGEKENRVDTINKVPFHLVIWSKWGGQTSMLVKVETIMPSGCWRYVWANWNYKDVLHFG